MSGFWPVVEAVIRKADIVVLVFDARMPELSKNKLLEEKVNRLNRPLVYACNKIDLINPSELEKLKAENPDWFFVSGRNNLGLSYLKRQLLIMGKRLKKDNPQVGFVGYPNVGKSAIINAIAHRAKAVVSPFAGTTRGHQIIRAGGLNIIDSPGVIPFEDKDSRLGIVGAKNPEKIFNPEKAAVRIIEMILEKSPEVIKERYGVEGEESDDSYSIMIKIGKKRGYLKKGGEVDETKTAITLIREWQTGKLKL